MSINSLPKATLEKFLKSNTSLKITKDSLQLLLFLANQYVIDIANKANHICEQENKVSVTVSHLQSVLVKECGIINRLHQLEEISLRITLQKKEKREASKLLYERIEKMKLQDEPLRENEKKQVIFLKKFDELQRALNSNDQIDFNYEELEEQTNKATSKQVIDCDSL